MALWVSQIGRCHVEHTCVGYLSLWVPDLLLLPEDNRWPFLCHSNPILAFLCPEMPNTEPCKIAWLKKSLRETKCVQLIVTFGILIDSNKWHHVSQMRKKNIERLFCWYFYRGVKCMFLLQWLILPNSTTNLITHDMGKTVAPQHHHSFLLCVLNLISKAISSFYSEKSKKRTE